MNIIPSISSGLSLIRNSGEKRLHKNLRSETQAVSTVHYAPRNTRARVGLSSPEFRFTVGRDDDAPPQPGKGWGIASNAGLWASPKQSGFIRGSWKLHQESITKMDNRDTKSNSAHLENVTNNPEESSECATSPWQCLAQNPWVILFCLYGNLGALMYGFDNLVLSLALSMPGFE